jgi:organic hydroperoxide reductase OsmC/OhrA
MARAVVELANVAGTEAALGWANGHTLVVDRADGVAGGRGLGFNGAQLLALALGGCFANDLRYTAHARGVALGRIGIQVSLDMSGEPPIATGASLAVEVETTDGSDPAPLIAAVRGTSMVSNSVGRGFPVTFDSAAPAAEEQS